MLEMIEREFTFALSLPWQADEKVNGVYPVRHPTPSPSEVNQFLRGLERGDGLLERMAEFSKVHISCVLRWQREGSMYMDQHDGRWFQRYRFWVLDVRRNAPAPMDQGDIVRAAGRLD